MKKQIVFNENTYVFLKTYEKKQKQLIRVRGVPERLISSLRACAMGGHRVSVLVVFATLVLVLVVVLAGGSRRVARPRSHGIPRDPM